MSVAIVVQVAALGLLTAPTGCKGAPERKDPALVEQSDAATDDEILFAAVLDVFAEQSLDIDLQSPERGIVLSKWSDVNHEVRHRWIGRVFRARMGLVLEVHSEYERRESSPAGTSWVAADDPYTQRDAKREETEMGETIQERFRALKSR